MADFVRLTVARRRHRRRRRASQQNRSIPASRSCSMPGPRCTAARRRRFELFVLSADDSLHEVPADPEFHFDVATLARTITKVPRHGGENYCCMNRYKAATTSTPGFVDDLERPRRHLPAREATRSTSTAPIGAVLTLLAQRIAELRRRDEQQRTRCAAATLHKSLQVPVRGRLSGR